MRRSYTLILIGLLCARALYPQRPWVVEAAYTQGGFYTHSTLRMPLSHPIRSLDVSLCLPTDGRRYWQQIHHFPDMGLRLRVRDMGLPHIYGYAISLVPYLTFYPWEKGKSGFSIAHGTGLSYITKIQNEYNPRNKLISSHINAASFLKAGLHYQMSPHWRMAATLEFSHESNGNFKRNNRGFNVWAAGIAVQHRWNGVVTRKTADPAVQPVKCGLFSAELACGMHDYNMKTGQLQFTPEVTLAFMLQHNDRFRSFAGMGYSIFPASDVGAAPFVLIGEEVMLGNLSVRYSLGTYLKALRPELRWIGKVGIGYYPFHKRSDSTPNPVLRGMYFGTYLKAHRSVAAHVEFTVGNVF